MTRLLACVELLERVAIVSFVKAVLAPETSVRPLTDPVIVPGARESVACALWEGRRKEGPRRGWFSLPMGAVAWMPNLPPVGGGARRACCAWKMEAGTEVRVGETGEGVKEWLLPRGGGRWYGWMDGDALYGDEGLGGIDEYGLEDPLRLASHPSTSPATLPGRLPISFSGVGGAAADLCQRCSCTSFVVGVTPVTRVRRMLRLVGEGGEGAADMLRMEKEAKGWRRADWYCWSGPRRFCCRGRTGDGLVERSLKQVGKGSASIEREYIGGECVPVLLWV